MGSAILVGFLLLTLVITVGYLYSSEYQGLLDRWKLACDAFWKKVVSFICLFLALSFYLACGEGPFFFIPALLFALLAFFPVASLVLFLSAGIIAFISALIAMVGA